MFVHVMQPGTRAFMFEKAKAKCWSLVKYFAQWKPGMFTD